MDFAESSELSDRLVKGVRNSGGTICLSHLHSAELCRVEDPRHAKEIDRLLDQIMPHVFCLDANSNLRPRGRDKFQLVGDLVLAEIFARNSKRTTPGYFEQVWSLRKHSRTDHPENLVEIFHDSTDAMVESFNKMRQDEEFRERARKFNPSNGYADGWSFLGELMRSLFLNENERLDQHDVVDIQHAMNLLHCDFALLDRTWTSKANQARDRLKEAGVSFARCYSKRNGGIEQFLNDLSSFNRS